MISSTVLVFVFIAILTYYFWSRHGKRNLPPGPTGLPFIGNLLQLGRQPHLQMAKWAKEYGDIYRVSLAGSLTLCINDHKLNKEMMSQDSGFTGRMDMTVLDMYDGGKAHGLINTEGEVWEQLRRFTLRQLRDFGFGKNTMESHIIEEVKETVEWMKSQDGKPVDDIKEKFTLGVVNALWTIISGKRYKHDDPFLLDITQKLHQNLKDMVEKGALLLFAPSIRHIAPEWSGYNMFRKLMKDLLAFFEQAVEDHKETYSDDSSRDFIDAFLKEIKQTTDPGSAFHGEVGERQLAATIADLFFAGSDTTSTTLSWTMLYLAHFSEIQTKLQKEIKEITGNSRDCCLSDRPNMPYAEAVIAEVLRYSSLVPSGVAHRSTVERSYRGYTIPKNTIIMTNAYYIHNNPAIWGDPQNFRPERFLSPDGKVFTKHEALLAFSIGRRQCLGESLARDTLFLFITNIVQKFTLELVTTGSDEDLLEPDIGLLLNPKPFKIVFKDRLV